MERILDWDSSLPHPSSLFGFNRYNNLRKVSRSHVVQKDSLNPVLIFVQEVAFIFNSVHKIKLQ